MYREDGSRMGACVNSFLMHSLAEKLWWPLKYIAYNPIYSVIALLLIYVIFSIIYLPLMLISYIITTYGSFLLFLIELNYFGEMTPLPNCA